MAEGQYVTRAEVQAMIAEAVARGGGGGATDGREGSYKHRPPQTGPSAWGESAIEVRGIAMGRKVAMQDAIIAAAEAKKQEEKKAAEETELEHGGMGKLPTQLGGKLGGKLGEDLPTRRGGKTPTRITGTIATRKKGIEAKPKPEQRAEPEPVQIAQPLPPDLVKSAIIQILTAMKGRDAEIKAWVSNQIIEAVPEPIRTMGTAQTVYYGDYLQLAPGTTNLRKTAVWGPIPQAAEEGFRLDDLSSFGYLLHPDGDLDAVRIYTGTINGVTISQTDITCSAGTNVVYARVAKAAGGAGTIQVAATLPAENATYYYYWLYTFTVTSGTATLTKAARPFNIETGIPSGGADGYALKQNSNLASVWTAIRELPSNANATRYRVLQISANVGAADDPTKWTINFVEKENMKATGSTQFHVFQADGSGGVTVGTVKWI